MLNNDSFSFSDFLDSSDVNLRNIDHFFFEKKEMGRNFNLALGFVGAGF